jgi:hypothetical protein
MSESLTTSWKRLAAGCAALLALALLTACGPNDVPPDSGVRGTVTVGPMCAVVHVGTDCPDKPLQAELQIMGADKKTIARSRSDFAGRFEIPLAPGSYTLVAVPPNPGGPPFAPSIMFSVTEGEWTELTVQYDTGIR